MWCRRDSIACELNVGSTLAAEDLPVADHRDLLVRGVQPARHLVVGDDEDPPYPGRERVQGAQRVTQLVVRGVPGVVGVLAGRLPGAQRRGLARPPRGVAAVDPGVDDVDRE